MKIFTKVIFLFLITSNYFVCNAQIQFAQYQAITTGSSAEVVCIGDINNDGRKDVILGTGSYSDPANDFKIFVFHQKQDGTLDTPVKYPYPSITTQGLKTIDIKDINNDALNDIVIGYDDKIGIFYQNISGSLNPMTALSVNASVRSLKAGDVNSDGINDIAVGTSVSDNSMYVLYQNSNNTFNTVSFPKSNSNFNDVTISDVNSDGKNDLIFSSSLSSEGIQVYAQNNSGSLNSSILYSQTNVNALAVGDLNNDGKNDAVVCKGGNTPNSKLAIWMQNPTLNQFQNSFEISAYDVPNAVEIDDLNNDGKNEILVIHGGWMKLSCYEQNSQGNYSSYSLFQLPYASNYETNGLAIGDINNDGKKDVAIADYNSGLIILYNISTLGINENQLSDTIKLYPNPTQNFITIDLPENLSSEFISYEIYNTIGECLLTEKKTGFNDNTNTVSFEKFPNGIYFLKLRIGDNEFIKKIVKN